MIEIQKLHLRIPAADAGEGRRIGEAVAAGLSGLDDSADVKSSQIDQLRIRIDVADGAGPGDIAQAICNQVTNRLNEMNQPK